MPSGNAGPTPVPERVVIQWPDWFKFLFFPVGPIDTTIKRTTDIIPGWFNDTTIFAGMTALGVVALSGGSVIDAANPKKRARTRRKAPRRARKAKPDYYSLAARFLDKAQPSVSHGLASFLSQPAIALPFVHSYIQGAENLHLLKKETGDKLQAINAGLMLGTYASMIGRAIV